MPDDNVTYYADACDVPADLQCYCKRLFQQTWFEHPLHREMFPFEKYPNLTEFLFELEGQFLRLLSNHRWVHALRMVTDQFAASYLLHHIEPNIPNSKEGDKIYWDLVFECVRMRNNHYIQGENFHQLFLSRRSGRSKFLSGNDYDEFSTLPETFTAWRGVVADGLEEANRAVSSGYSWTITPEIAQKFARRMVYKKGQFFVAKAELRKENTIAYFPSCGEGEVLVWPGSVKCWELEQLGKK